MSNTSSLLNVLHILVIVRGKKGIHKEEAMHSTSISRPEWLYYVTKTTSLTQKWMVQSTSESNHISFVSFLKTGGGLHESCDSQGPADIAKTQKGEPSDICSFAEMFREENCRQLFFLLIETLPTHGHQSSVPVPPSWLIQSLRGWRQIHCLSLQGWKMG